MSFRDAKTFLQNDKDTNNSKPLKYNITDAS